VKFAFIKDHQKTFDIRIMCRVLEVSRAGYYAWRARPASARAIRRHDLVKRIATIQEQHRGVYGSPRVHRVLQSEGESISENTVASVMHEAGIRAKRKRRFVPRTTDAKHASPVAPNVLNREFAAEKPNQKWAADITYIPTDEGWLYLAGVIDLYSRKVVGWAMADHLRSELVGAALTMALDHRRPGPALLHHSDRGVQYACDDYQHLLASRKITVSMSGKGECWDNACTESFWATLKTELVHHQRYATRAQAKASIFEYIEVFYNRMRLHSSLGYLSPEAFEAHLN
jgi:putative transposase